MYASNEDEFNREDDDWVFLRQTPPATTIPNEAVDLVANEQSNSSSSSSSSSSSTGSLKSDRSDSSSSLSSIEHEHLLNDEQENHLLAENPVLASHSIDDDDNNDLLSTGENKQEIFSSEIIIKQDNENETTPVINEYDLFNNGPDSSNEMIESSNNLRQRTGANVQHTVEQYSVIAEEEERSSPTMYYYRPRNNKKWIVYGFFFVLIAGTLIFNRVIVSQRLMINKLTEELKMTNQRLDEIKIVSMENMEQKLTKEFEEKFQKLIQQKTIEFNQEKFSLISQINELYQIINLTQQNLTNTIHQLFNKNEQLKEQITILEHRLQIAEQQNSKRKETCPKGTDFTKSTGSSFDRLLGHLIKQTASIAEDTSGNLSSLFEQLSASLSDLVDRRHEYVEESKRKLNDLAGSSEQVQTTLRRGVENLSSSLRKAQSSYVTWLRTRAQQREQARMEQTEREKNGDDEEEEGEQKTNRRAWRWTFQRSQDREQLRHQTPITKKHSTQKQYSCHSKCQFPVNHICTMKNWMERFFRP